MNSRIMRLAGVLTLTLLTLSITSSAFGAVDMFLQIKDSKGKITKVPVASDGSFTTPALKAGTYTFSWSLTSKPAGSTARIKSSTGNTDPSPATVCLSYAMYSVQKGARETGSGLATGKRMHKPVTITKSIDKSSPLLKTTFETITVDDDCDGLEGTISFKSPDGKTMALDDWSPRSN